MPGQEKVILREDTLHAKDRQLSFLVPRSKDSLRLMLIGDRMQRNIALAPRNSFAYFLNLYYNLGVGMLVDAKNPKRYSYPRRVYLDSNYAQREGFKSWKQPQRGDFNLQVSFPYLNSFYFQPAGERTKANTGFWGLGLGLDYYHQERQYLSLNLHSLTDAFLPVPAPVTYDEGIYENMVANFVSLSNHHRVKRFDWGYGLAWAEHFWRLDDLTSISESNPPDESRRTYHHSLGAVLSSHYYTGRSFHIGLLYRPSLIRFLPEAAFRYEHSISVNLAWKIRL
jgi:hypothetical protein